MCGFIKVFIVPSTSLFLSQLTSNMNRWHAKADADWLKNYTTERQVPSHELHPNTPSVLISPQPGWLWVSVLICFIIRSWSKSRDSCTVIRGGEVEDEGRRNRTHYKNSFMWGRARDSSPKNSGEQIVVFESPPLARAHATWDAPGPDAQGGQRCSRLEPNPESFHNKTYSGCTITLPCDGKF